MRLHSLQKGKRVKKTDQVDFSSDMVNELELTIPQALSTIIRERFS